MYLQPHFLIQMFLQHIALLEEFYSKVDECQSYSDFHLLDHL